MPPKPSLTTFDAVALMVGLVLGAGIFRAPQLVAQNTGSVEAFLGLWVVGGVISLIGALCYAELTTAYPHAGGEYHFLRRAFGNGPAFLFAWSRSTVIQTGSIAILAYVFGDYLAPVLSLGERGSAFLAVAAIVGLTGLNIAGLRRGKNTQVVLTLVELAGLAAVIVAGLFLVNSAPAQAPAAGSGVLAPGLALVFVLLTFGGWNEAAYLSAEVRGGPRAMARALLWGTGIITVLYLLANLAYVKALGFAGVAASPVVAADVMSAAGGQWGATLLSFIVAVSALTSINATIITGARSTYALGRDFEALRVLGEWKEQGSTPANALLLQGAIALALVAFGAIARGGFEAMVAYTAPVFWFFLALVALSLIVLRRSEPDALRPFRVPLYPLTPLLFAGAALFMLYSSIRYAGSGALLGVAVMLAGVPILMLARFRATRPVRRPESV